MAARHRVTAGRHLGAGRLVRLTQDFFVYNAPCPDGSCNEGPTCECPPCEDGDFLDGTGVGGADNSRNATDVLLAGGSAAFHQTSTYSQRAIFSLKECDWNNSRHVNG